MAKSWKKFIAKPEETKETGLANQKASPEPLDFQKIIAQDETLSQLVKEREALEQKLKNEVSNTQLTPQEQRYFNQIPSFAEKKKIDQQWLKKKEKLSQKNNFEKNRKRKQDIKIDFTEKIKTNSARKNQLKTRVRQKVTEKPKEKAQKEIFKNEPKKTIEKPKRIAKKTDDFLAKRDKINAEILKIKQPVKKGIDTFENRIHLKKQVAQEVNKTIKKIKEKDVFALKEQLKEKKVNNIAQSFSTKKSPSFEELRDQLKQRKVFDSIRQKIKQIDTVKEKTVDGIKQKKKEVEKTKERITKIKDDWEKIKEKKKELLQIKDKFDKGFEVEKLVPMDKFTDSFEKQYDRDAMKENPKDEEKIAEEKKEKQKEERLAQLREERKKEQQEEQKREERKARKKDKFND